jgi:hypothetical protein
MRMKTIILLMLSVPLLLISLPLNFNQSEPQSGLYAPGFPDRTWRLNEVRGEYYAGDWIQDAKSDYVYSLTMPTRLDTLKAYAWNNVEYILMNKIAYTYDATGLYNTQDIYYAVNGNSDELSERNVFQYNAQNRVVMITWESYSSGIRNWVLFGWQKISYNGDAIASTDEYYVSGDQGVPVWQHTDFVNDGQGRPIIMTRQASLDSLSWYNDKHTEINYHANDTTTGNDYIAAIGNQYIGAHALNFGPFYTRAMVTLSIDQYYDGGWQNAARSEFSYDTQNRVTNRLDKYWDAGWQDMMQIEYSYDANGNFDESLETQWNGAEWENSYRHTLVWGQDTSNDDNTIPVASDLQIKASPNPFAQQVSLRAASKDDQFVQISIYNLRGQLVKTIPTYTNADVSWDGKDNDLKFVSNGVYLIRAASGSQSTTTKLLKMR